MLVDINFSSSSDMELITLGQYSSTLMSSDSISSDLGASMKSSDSYDCFDIDVLTMLDVRAIALLREIKTTHILHSLPLYPHASQLPLLEDHRIHCPHKFKHLVHLLSATFDSLL